MKEKVITSIETLFPYLESITDQYYFRGFSDYDEYMRPSLGRGGNQLIKDEVKIIQEFAKLPELESLNIKIRNLHELLDLGQHYCLPTRLLDWTRKSLVALYFAIGKTPFTQADMNIALISRDNPEISDDWSTIDDLAPYQLMLGDWDPFYLNAMAELRNNECDEFSIFKSRVTHPQFAKKFYESIYMMNDRMLITHQINPCNLRIINQDGLFSVHKEVTEVFPISYLDGLIKIKLCDANKTNLSNILSQKYNVNESQVLPKPAVGSPLENIEIWCKKIKNSYKPPE